MLTLLTVIRNEEKYIQEWLIYYHLIGVEKFIVFLHINTDNSYEIIKNLSFKDKIQIIKIEEENNIGVFFQNNILKQAIELCETDYIIYLDIDEFLNLNYEHINDFLANYKNIGGIAIYQNVFGSCGHIVSPTGLVIENYLYRNNDNLELDKKTVLLSTDPVYLFGLVKILLNKNTIKHIKTIHDVVCSKKIITEDGSLFQKQKFKRNTHNICINHYFTKSKQDWEFKTSRKRISGFEKYSDNLFTYFSNQNYLDENIKNKYVTKIKLFK